MSSMNRKILPGRVEIFRVKGEAGTLLPVSRTGRPSLVKHQEFDSVRIKML